MTPREALNQVLDQLPNDRLNEVLVFAKCLTSQEERQEWQQFGQNQLARAYGDDEPEYTVADLKVDLDK